MRGITLTVRPEWFPVINPLKKYHEKWYRIEHFLRDWHKESSDISSLYPVRALCNHCRMLLPAIQRLAGPRTKILNTFEISAYSYSNHFSIFSQTTIFIRGSINPGYYLCLFPLFSPLCFGIL